MSGPMDCVLAGIQPGLRVREDSTDRSVASAAGVLSKKSRIFMGHRKHLQRFGSPRVQEPQAIAASLGLPIELTQS